MQPFIDAPECIGKEIGKLPPRGPQGSRVNLIRAIAAGFILMGYRAEAATDQANKMIDFYDCVQRGEHEQDYKSRE
jgi:hypothetical protein